MSAITKLAERLSALDFERLPEDVIEAARQRLFDSLASFVVGAASSDGQLIRRLAGDAATTGELIRYMCAATRSTSASRSPRISSRKGASACAWSHVVGSGSAAIAGSSAGGFAGASGGLLLADI